MTTQLAESLTAKKKFVDSLTYFKKYLGDVSDPSSEVSVKENRVARPSLTVKRGRSVPRIRKIRPTTRTRKRTFVFSVHKVVTEEESSFESEVVAEGEITPEKVVTMDVDKLSEDDFYKILQFLESERSKLEEVSSMPISSRIKHSNRRVY